MDGKVMTIVLFVGTIAHTPVADAARPLNLGQSWALLHGLAYPQSERAIVARFGKPPIRTAAGTLAYQGHGGWISCDRTGSRITGCTWEGK